MTGKNAQLAVTTSATAIITAATGAAIRIDNLVVACIATGDTITVDHFRSSTARHICKTVSVPLNTAYLPFDNGPYWLEEGDTLRLTAATNSRLEATASYVVFT
jgi:hypothetical protein